MGFPGAGIMEADHPVEALHDGEGRVGDFLQDMEDFKKAIEEYPPRSSRPRSQEGPRGGASTRTQEDEWVTGWKEISRYTGLGISTLKRAAMRGEFKVKKLGGISSYVTAKKSDLDTWRSA